MKWDKTQDHGIHAIFKTVQKALFERWFQRNTITISLIRNNSYKCEKKKLWMEFAYKLKVMWN